MMRITKQRAGERDTGKHEWIVASSTPPDAERVAASADRKVIERRAAIRIESGGEAASEANPAHRLPLAARQGHCVTFTAASSTRNDVWLPLSLVAS